MGNFRVLKLDFKSLTSFITLIKLYLVAMLYYTIQKLFVNKSKFICQYIKLVGLSTMTKI